MHAKLHALPFALAFLAAPAFAQAPLFIELSPGSFPTDVTVTPAVAGGASEIVVVGYNNAGLFRWTYTSGLEVDLQATGSSNGDVSVSRDGSIIAATTFGLDGIERASRLAGGVWTQGPGLGAVSGTSQTTAYDISGDGNIVAGLGWLTAGDATAYIWTQPTTVANIGGPFSDPSSRVNAADFDGNIVVGWKDLLNGQRVGARWVNGVLQPQLMLGPLFLGEALCVNDDGTRIAGGTIFNGSGVNATAAWRWDSGVVTVLPNLAGATTRAQGLGITNDGTRIVGHVGGNIPFGTRDVIWIDNAPQSLKTHLQTLGTVGVAGYDDLGICMAISHDGNVIVGRGTGFLVGANQPSGGWVVVYPGALSLGSAFCFGDGTGAACPCANNGSVGHGCASSIVPAGARLAATGIASIANDSVVLAGSDMPNAAALYFQGTTQSGAGAGVAFGDGLRCAAGTIVRLGTKANSGGASRYPTAGDASVSTRGLVTAPGTRTYQVWYRNSAAFCTPATFNLSNGLSITWTN
jgi:uncharacterized membrane protein